MDREQLADFLYRRRGALQPEDVGLQRSPRRRTAGLRREEVAALAAISTDYYARLEQRRGPQPSVTVLSALARALRLTRDESEHLQLLAGHVALGGRRRLDHVGPALLRVLDRLDAPALVVTDLGVTLAQNAPGAALLGSQLHYEGMDRYLLHRWFVSGSERTLYPEANRDHHERHFVAGLRAAIARRPDEDGERLVRCLLDRSPHFAAAWARHDVVTKRGERKRIVSPTVGLIEVDCQILTADDDGQVLLVFTATPGTDDHDKLRLLRVVGEQRFRATSSLSTRVG